MDDSKNKPKVLSDEFEQVEKDFNAFSTELRGYFVDALSKATQSSDIHKEEVLGTLGNVKRNAQLLVQIIEHFKGIKSNLDGVSKLAIKTKHLRAQCNALAESLDIDLNN